MTSLVASICAYAVTSLLFALYAAWSDSRAGRWTALRWYVLEGLVWPVTVMVAAFVLSVLAGLRALERASRLFS